MMLKPDSLKINLNKIKEKEEYFYAGVVFILIFLALFFFFRKNIPNLKLYRTLVKQVNVRDKELRDRKATIAQIYNLKQDINQIEEEYNSFTQKVLFQPGSLEAVRVITDIAQGLKMEFLSLQPLAMQKLDFSTREDTTFLKFFQKQGIVFFIWEIPISIKIKASYATLLDFIKKLEEARRFIKIKNIRIVRDSSSPLVHNAEITISMFSLPSGGKIKKNE